MHDESKSTLCCCSLLFVGRSPLPNGVVAISSGCTSRLFILLGGGAEFWASALHMNPKRFEKIQFCVISLRTLPVNARGWTAWIFVRPQRISYSGQRPSFYSVIKMTLRLCVRVAHVLPSATCLWLRRPGIVLSSGLRLSRGGECLCSFVSWAHHPNDAIPHASIPAHLGKKTGGRVAVISFIRTFKYPLRAIYALFRQIGARLN